MNNLSGFIGKLFFLLILIITQNVLHAQQKPPSQAEIDKMIKKAEAMKNDPNVKKALQMAGGDMSDIDDEESSFPGKLPIRNTKKLAAIPKTPLTTEVLNTYISDLHAKIFSVLTPAHKTKIKQVAEHVKSNPLALSRSAVTAWYSNSPYIALGLAVEAGKMNHSNAEVLNTLAALLSFNGIQQKSIPLLTYLNNKIPGNATVLNNLGQAYLALGDLNKAEDFLSQSIAALPTHHEANKSLAMIYRSQGKLTRARQCITKSLEGVHSETAIEIAKDLGISEEDIDNAIILPLKNFKAPEYFNNYKYQIPELCESVQEAKKVSMEHQHFIDFLDVEQKKYERLANEEALIIQKEMNKMVSEAMTAIKNKNVVKVALPPMFEKAKRMISYWMLEFQQFGNDIVMPAYLKMQERRTALDQEYNKEYTRINMSNSLNECALFDNLANKYLPLYAANQRDFIEKFLTPYRGYMDELMYWSQYLNLLHDARFRIFELTRNYLQELERLSRETKIIFPACTPEGDKPKNDIEEEKTEKKECPFNISISLIVAEISMDCEKFALEADAGFAFSFEKNFITKQSTIAIGIGMSGDLSLPIPGIDWSGEAGASQKVFIVFDGNNHFQDVGFTMNASAGVDISVIDELGGDNLGGSGVSAGYTISLNDGISFAGEATGIFEGAFK